MSAFADLLSAHIQDSGLTILHLARASGFEATHITRFKNGTRVPRNDSKMHALADALCLSPTDREQLLNACIEAQIGQERYQEYNAVISLVESGDTFPTLQIPASYTQDLAHISTIQKQSNVLNVLAAVLEQEAAREDGVICFMGQPDNQQVMDVLFRTVSNHPTAQIQHILCLRSAHKDGETATYNTRCAQHMLMMMRHGARYEASYYYDREPVSQSNTLHFPSTIITSQHVLLIAADYEDAILHQDAHLVAFYRALFDRQLPRCRRFGQSYATLVDTMNYYIHAFDAMQNAAVVDFSYQPCVLLYVKPEYCCYLKPDFLAQSDTPYFFSAHLPFLKQLHITDCFTMEGLHEFLDSGLIMYLRKYMNPVPVDIRRRIITDLLHGAEEGTYDFRILKPQGIQVPRSLTVFSPTTDKVIIELTHPNDTNSSLIFTEPSINNAVAGFVQFLPESHFVYPREESLRMLQDTIRKRLSE